MATLEARLSALAQAIGADIKALFSRSLPAGGASGQVLAKSSATDYAVGWADPSAGGAGTPLSLYDEWDDTNFGVNNIVTSPFIGAAISSGTMNTAIPSVTLNGKNWNGAYMRSSTTANGGYKYQTSSLVTMLRPEARSSLAGGATVLFTGVTVRAGFTTVLARRHKMARSSSRLAL
jgi:hypothetical protein